MAEGLADLALYAAVGPGWGSWAAGIYADLGLRFDGERAEALSEASAALADVRQDAALMLHTTSTATSTTSSPSCSAGFSSTTPGPPVAAVPVRPVVAGLYEHLCRGLRLLRSWLDARPAEVGLTSGSAGFWTSR